MIHCFRITLAHTTPINQWKTSLCEVIQSKNLSQCCCPQKEHLLGNLHWPNAFSRKGDSSSTLNLPVKKLGYKNSIPLEILLGIYWYKCMYVSVQGNVCDCVGVCVNLCKGMRVSVQVGACVCIECYGEVVNNRS